MTSSVACAPGRRQSAGPVPRSTPARAAVAGGLSVRRVNAEAPWPRQDALSGTGAPLMARAVWAPPSPLTTHYHGLELSDSVLEIAEERVRHIHDQPRFTFTQECRVGMCDARSVPDRVQRVQNRCACVEDASNVFSSRSEVLQTRMVLTQAFEERCRRGITWVVNSSASHTHQSSIRGPPCGLDPWR
jgi:hypothetical protein